jgi:hypothetical protein
VSLGGGRLLLETNDDFKNPIVTREVVVEPISGRRPDVPPDRGSVDIEPPAPKP